MKVFLLSVFIVLALHTASPAQQPIPYKFTVYHENYKPLRDGINLVSEVWFNSDYFALPMPFNVMMDTVNCKAPFIAGGSTLVTDTGKGIISSFFLTDANLIDKGFIGSDYIFQSPIRYQVVGIPGARIFKLEIPNAAFFNEIIYATNYDSVFMQLWLYETSNIVELRYGPSHISHGYNYFPNKGFPGAGYIQDVDSSLNGTYHLLGGDPSNPFIESIESVNGVLKHKPAGLNSFPESGTVYRFTPGAAAIDITPPVNSTGITNSTKIYPTNCTNELLIEYATDKVNYRADYQLYSVDGTLKNSNTLTPNSINHINTSALIPGIYIVQINTYEGIKRQKIIKL